MKFNITGNEIQISTAFRVVLIKNEITTMRAKWNWNSKFYFFK